MDRQANQAFNQIEHNSPYDECDMLYDWMVAVNFQLCLLSVVVQLGLTLGLILVSCVALKLLNHQSGEANTGTFRHQVV